MNGIIKLYPRHQTVEHVYKYAVVCSSAVFDKSLGTHCLNGLYIASMKTYNKLTHWKLIDTKMSHFSGNNKSQNVVFLQIFFTHNEDEEIENRTKLADNLKTALRTQPMR